MNRNSIDGSAQRAFRKNEYAWEIATRLQFHSARGSRYNRRRVSKWDRYSSKWKERFHQLNDKLKS